MTDTTLQPLSPARRLCRADRGYGVVIPRSCIAGWNDLTVGFAATVAGACLAYYLRAASGGPECRGPRW